MQLKESTIDLLFIGIQNASSIYKDLDPVPGIRNPRRGIQNPRLFPYMERCEVLKNQYGTVNLGLLLVFSVTPFKIDQNKKSKPFNRSSQESGK